MHRAAELRKEMTPAEHKLWSALSGKQLGVKFRKQHALGPYITDFCCIKEKLIIEVDGSQHLDQEDYDAERSAYFASRGYRVLRFWNNQVSQDLNGVVIAIQDALAK
ncbi:MAG: endonuclease domain-containing protein [Anaerolineae bacterium]|jgi:very-short-patch-repair endonuclease|nr:endonuclease domain-containing protein [Anaerolineae bacterium]MBT7189866.1 endonuclease domain-containing protein [Anaerolineae bacterium]MBT7991371.1 endonuclease domain-containing protein [Anaerolineae bacterium]